MRMGLLLIIAHLVAAIASVLVAGDAALWPGRSRWLVVWLATVCAMLNAGAVVAELG